MKNTPDILIVDDNESFCKTMSLVLKRKKYNVTTAQEGRKAIKETEKKPFDLIFIDIKMPKMNGVETYKRIKRIRPEASVVMMTAYAFDELIKEALDEGAEGIIHKPIDIQEVMSFIELARKAKEKVVILVVDDDEGNCIGLRKILNRKGFKVSIAHTGEEAIAKMKKRKHDIIFIDMKLPKINGLETFLIIKKIEPKAVAIMMTAYHQEMAGLIEKALINKAYTYLNKPLDMEKVIRLVEDISERRKKQGKKKCERNGEERTHTYHR